MMLEDLYRLLRAGHVQAQGIVDTMTQPIVVIDQSMVITAVNNSFIKAFKVDRDEVLGHNIFHIGNGQWDIGDLRRLMNEVIPRATAVIGFEVQHDFPNIGQRIFLVDARKLVHPHHNITNILVLFEDATERRRSDAEKDFIVSETRHRMKNLFAVVRSLASQTEADGRTAAEFRDTFLNRLEATLRAQEIASNPEPAELTSLLRQSVPATEANRIEVEGQAVAVDSAKIVVLSMMFHELATNSLKYGALSAEEGRVKVDWQVDEEEPDKPRLTLIWKDKGGPPVQSPERVGYGTKLIQGTAAH